jgi:hypothetical protein
MNKRFRRISDVPVSILDDAIGQSRTATEVLINLGFCSSGKNLNTLRAHAADYGRVLPGTQANTASQVKNTPVCRPFKSFKSIPRDEFIRVVDEHETQYDIILALGFSIAGTSYASLRKRAEELGVRLPEQGETSGNSKVDTTFPVTEPGEQGKFSSYPDTSYPDTSAVMPGPKKGVSLPKPPMLPPPVEGSAEEKIRNKMNILQSEIDDLYAQIEERKKLQVFLADLVN